MNKKILFFSFFLFSISIQNIFSSNPDWQTIYLTPGGGNMMDGVEAYFQLESCNGEDVVLVKFINHNDYTVQLEWYDAVFTSSLKWINHDDERNKKILLIAPKNEVRGECTNNNPELVIRLKGFVVSKEDFKRYSTFQLNVLAVQQ